MEEMRLEELSDIEFDVLKEISNIGTGNAATAISKMLDGRVDIKVPDIRFLDFNELPEIIGGAENEVIGILVALERDVEGMMMFVMDKKSAS
ncbi:MAG: chemotaxis protein CheC, partial [Lachnospiraceae bacterium]|nr:chemotaxis protein CheC [Lachnospiraceae bacterium]